MYQRSYAEIVEDASKAARERERALLERAIRKLAIAKIKGARSAEAFEATSYLRRLWTVLIEDLGSEGNSLPESLRASLISIGIWILKEADLIDFGKSDNFDAVIEINQMIADGLT